MKFVALRKNKLVNRAAIAQAAYEENRDTKSVKVKVVFISGVKDEYLSDDARTLWATLQKAVAE